MKSLLVFSTAALVFLISNTAAAFTHKAGVITEVNPGNSTITVKHTNGTHANYKLAKDTKVWLAGQRSPVEALEPNQTVELKLAPEAAPEIEYVEAEIVALNLNEGLATVQPVGEHTTVTISVNAETRISGKARRLEQLAEGQTIKYRLAQK